MGYTIEQNDQVRISKHFFDTATLRVGKQYNVRESGVQSFVLHLPMLLTDDEQNFYGYVVIRAMELAKEENEIYTMIHFEILSLFSEQECEIYKRNFQEAAKMAGEIK